MRRRLIRCGSNRVARVYVFIGSEEHVNEAKNASIYIFR